MSHTRFRLAMPVALVCSLGFAGLWAQGPAKSTRTKTKAATGLLAGAVVDGYGVPQMGAAVAIISPDGRLVQRLFTDPMGAFRLEHVAPGVYTVRVTLASFLPAIRERVPVDRDGQSFVSINLNSLSDALAGLTGGPRSKPEPENDWKWVVRASGQTRPVLRYASAKSKSPAPDSQLRVDLLGGGGASGTFGSEADFTTAFAMARSLFRDTTLLLSGSLGMGSAPAMAFRSGFRRERFDGTASDLSFTVRQVFLGADRVEGLPGTGHGRKFESLAMAYDDTLMSGPLRLDYGMQLDSTSFVARSTSASPRGRLTAALGSGFEFHASYSSGLPRRQSGRQDPVRDASAQLALFPRMSQRDGALAVQRVRHAEVGVTGKLGGGTVEAAVFRDRVSNLAVTSALGGIDPGRADFLADPFSKNASFNAGRHQSSGFRIAYQRPIGKNLTATAAYTKAGMLAVDRQELNTDDLNELRQILKMRQRHALAVKMTAVLPATRATITGGYKWINRPAAVAGDFQGEGLGSADTGLNFTVRQPLPVIPYTGRMEAVADVRNLMGQGYVKIRTPDGRNLILLQNVRTFRGGLSFNF